MEAVTALLALVGVLVGAALPPIVNTFTGRHTARTERQLAAADEFLIGVREADDALRDLFYDASQSDVPVGIDGLRKAAGSVHAVNARVARVVMGFGPQHGATVAAHAVTKCLYDAKRAVMDLNDRDDRTQARDQFEKRLNTCLESAQEHAQKFSDSAWRETR